MTFTDSATGKETTFLSTGDATGFGMEVAQKIFEDELKSDIMTANHHGYFNFGAINELMAACEAVSPALILYPLGNGDYQGVLEYPHNQFVHELDSFKESFNAGNRGEYTIVKFPYVPGTVIKTTK